MFRRILLVFSDSELRTKVLKIIGLLLVARVLTHIPVPGLDLQDLSGILDDNPVFGLLDTISGGGYGTLSFVMLGISPYITASIIFQLLQVIIPKLAQIKKEEGQQGQQKINRWTRMLTVPLAALNAWGVMRYIDAQEGVNLGLGDSVLGWVSVIVAMVAGSVVMMWIGELISEFKMGNGISILILSGIVSKIPSSVGDNWNSIKSNIELFGERFKADYLVDFDKWKAFLWESPDWTPLRSVILLTISFLGTLILVVFMNDAIRKLLVVYTRRGHNIGGSRTLTKVKADLPIKVNIAGVIPIIFAVSFILFPSVIATFLQTSNLDTVKEKAAEVQTYLSSEPTTDSNNNVIEEPEKLDGEGVLGFYLVDSEEKLLAAKQYDPYKGQELFSFTINNFNTQCDYQSKEGSEMSAEEILKNQQMTDYKNLKTTFFSDMFMEFSLPCKFRASFLPEFGLHWNGILAYNLFYFSLVVFFTYFYTTNVAFKTEDVAENLQKSGAYIPGHKPGKETEKYLAYVSNRLNVVGSLFLAVIAIFPIIMSRHIDFGGGGGGLSSVVGGTSLLILVSVAMETLRQIEAQATAVDYERFTKY